MSNDSILADLRSGARAAAQALLAEFPALTLTSGKRDLAQQARAMAANVIINQRWIAETYAASPVRDACQAWVDRIVIAPVVADSLKAGEIEGGLLAILERFTPEMLRHLSWHLAGDAFDVQPVPEDGPTQYLQQLVDAHVSAGGQAKLLTTEGGLLRWHAQFSLA